MLCLDLFRFFVDDDGQAGARTDFQRLLPVVSYVDPTLIPDMHAAGAHRRCQLRPRAWALWVVPSAPAWPASAQA